MLFQMSKEESDERFANWLPWLVGVCVILALLDFAYEKHPHVRFEGWFNFFGFVGLLATGLCCVLAIGLRAVLAREEDYYDV